MASAVVTATDDSIPLRCPRKEVLSDIGISVRLKTLGNVRLGQKVEVQLDRLCGYGEVKFIGCVHFAKGLFIGVSLNDGIGSHDGSYRGFEYFRTMPNHGVFVRPDKIRPLSPRLRPEPTLKRARSDFSEAVLQPLTPALLSLEKDLTELQQLLRRVTAENKEMEGQLRREEEKLEQSTQRIAQLDEFVSQSNSNGHIPGAKSSHHIGSGGASPGDSGSDSSSAAMTFGVAPKPRKARMSKKGSNHKSRSSHHSRQQSVPTKSITDKKKKSPVMDENEIRVKKLAAQFDEVRQNLAEKEKRLSKLKSLKRQREKEKKRAREHRDEQLNLVCHGAMHKDRLIMRLTKAIRLIKQEKDMSDRVYQKLLRGDMSLNTNLLINHGYLSY